MKQPGLTLNTSNQHFHGIFQILSFHSKHFESLKRILQIEMSQNKPPRKIAYKDMLVKAKLYLKAMNSTMGAKWESRWSVNPILIRLGSRSQFITFMVKPYYINGCSAYYIYGQILLHLWLVDLLHLWLKVITFIVSITFMVNFCYIYGCYYIYG